MGEVIGWFAAHLAAAYIGAALAATYLNVTRRRPALGPGHIISCIACCAYVALWITRS